MSLRPVLVLPPSCLWVLSALRSAVVVAGSHLGPPGGVSDIDDSDKTDLRLSWVNWGKLLSTTDND